MKGPLFALPLTIFAPLHAADVLIVESLEGPVTTAGVTAFKNHLRRIDVPEDNLGNAMAYGVGGTSVKSLGRLYERSAPSC